MKRLSQRQTDQDVILQLIKAMVKIRDRSNYLLHGIAAIKQSKEKQVVMESEKDYAHGGLLSVGEIKEVLKEISKWAYEITQQHSSIETERIWESGHK